MVQPQAEVKSFPAEPINPLVSNSEGTYIIGGGVSGDIFLWEVSLHTCFYVRLSNVQTKKYPLLYGIQECLINNNIHFYTLIP